MAVPLHRHGAQMLRDWRSNTIEPQVNEQRVAAWIANELLTNHRAVMTSLSPLPKEQDGDPEVYGQWIPDTEVWIEFTLRVVAPASHMDIIAIDSIRDL